MATVTSRPPGLRGYDARWSDSTGTALVGPDGSDVAVANDQTQSAEAALVSVSSVTPASAGFVPFAIEVQSFPNAGAGAGTYNHGAFIGWNVGRHSSSTPVDGKPAILLGIEDNYFDNGGDEVYGTELYVQHWSPDGLTNVRPFYARMETKNGTLNATIFHEIGTHADGSWQVRTAPGDALIYANVASGVTIKYGLNVSTGNLQAGAIVGNATANKLLTLSAGAATGSVIIQNYAQSANNLIITDGGDISTKDGMSWNNFGATGMKFGGSSTQKIGFWGTTPVIRPTGTPAAATDEATAITLVNSLRASLLLMGLVAS